TLYGPYDKFSQPGMLKVVDSILYKMASNTNRVELWGDGTPTRDILYIKDFVSYLYDLMNKQLLNSIEQVNGQEYSIKKIATNAQIAANFNGEILWNSSKPNGQMRKVVMGSRPNKLTPLHKGMKETVEWLTTQ